MMEDKGDIEVTACLITFNHAKYVEKAIQERNIRGKKRLLMWPLLFEPEKERKKDAEWMVTSALRLFRPRYFVAGLCAFTSVNRTGS